MSSLVFFCSTAFAQTEVFRSKINFSPSDLNNFYSTVAVNENRVFFIANNYTLYAFDKKTNQLEWQSYAGYKSNQGPFFDKGFIFKRILEGKIMQLNAANADTLHTLKVEELLTQPFFKNEIMYCAAVSPGIGGAILAYDLKKNEIIWQKYIGHGVSFQPYFLKDKIVVNYEEQYWFEIDYNGLAVNQSKKCYSKNKEQPFTERFCKIQYDVVNRYHQDLALKRIMTVDATYYYGDNETVVLKNNKLQIINNKNKLGEEINIDKIITILETGDNDYAAILKVEKNSIWFFYENILAVYDFKMSKTIKAFDLTAWQAHQVVLDENTLWLISNNDGQLYGIQLNNE